MTPNPPATGAAPAGRVDRVRIDKWLWAARFHKTRGLAAAAVEAGQVRIDGERVKPARLVHGGEVVSVRKGGLTWEVEVTATGERRGSATQAATLYRESEASRTARETELARRKGVAAAHPVLDGRPTKRDRRKLEDFLNEP